MIGYVEVLWGPSPNMTGHSKKRRGHRHKDKSAMHRWQWCPSSPRTPARPEASRDGSTLSQSTQKEHGPTDILLLDF